ncbi:MAG: T9SS type A sorting domain-containing protein [Bacteroidetes bacterium]|nr:T9SS type A sorting domain-containing protein [Bacteroidota bacterium]
MKLIINLTNPYLPSLMRIIFSLVALLLLLSSTVPAQNPTLVKDIAPFPYGSRPDNFTALGNQLLFAANNYIGSSTNRELFISDGTTNGTQLLLDIIPGNSSSSPDRMIAIGGKVYFSVGDNTSGVLVYRPWVSDGTIAGTYSLFPPAATAYGYSLKVPSLYRAQDYFVEYHGEVYFVGLKDSTNNNAVIFKTDGTTSGTGIAIELPNTTSLPNLMEAPVVFNDTIYFSGTTNGGAYENLYKSDGTSANTFLVKSNLYLYAKDGVESYDNKMYFHGENPFGQSGGEPWVTDGTASGTFELADLRTDLTFGSNPSAFRRINGKLVFLASPNSNSAVLYAVDSLFGNIVIPLSPVSPLSLAYTADWLFTFNNTVLFKGGDAVNGYELWKSDGTIGGTGLLMDINPGAGDGNPQSYVEYCNEVYFTAQNPTTGTAQALYKTDGTQGGTFLLPGLISNPTGGSGITAKGVLNNVLYFSGQYDVNVGEELYSYAASCATGSNEMAAAGTGEVLLFPNPAQTRIEAIFNKESAVKYSIFDILGHLIASSDFQRVSQCIIDISNLESGIYFLEFDIDANRKTVKLVKE